MRRRRAEIHLAILFVLCAMLDVHAYASTEEWVRRGIDSAAQLASGNPNGAVQSAVPPIPVAKHTQIQPGWGNAGVRQNLPFAGHNYAPYVQTQAAYQGNVSLAPRQGLSHNVQAGAGNALLGGQVSSTAASQSRRKNSA